MIVIKRWGDIPNNKDFPPHWIAEVKEVTDNDNLDGWTIVSEEELLAIREIQSSEYASWEIARNERQKREAYATLRQEAYPTIGTQLDMLYKAMKSGLIPEVPDFVQAIDAVKQQFPKPEV